MAVYQSQEGTAAGVLDATVEPRSVHYHAFHQHAAVAVTALLPPKQC